MMCEDIWSDDEETSKTKDSKEGKKPQNVDRTSEGKQLFTCLICQRQFTKRQMLTHTPACELLYSRCIVCGVMYENEKKKEHFDQHVKDECECGLKVMKCKLKDHLMRCSARSICPYCKEPHRIKGLCGHLIQCGARETKCRKCNATSTIKDIVHNLHQCPVLCKLCGRRVEAKEMRYHLKTECPKREESCPICSKKMPWDELQKHLKTCKKVEKKFVPPGWACTTCGVKNSSGLDTCDFCASSKPVPVQSRPVQARPVPRPVVNNNDGVDSSKLQQLTAMGIDENDARRLLKRANNNVERAIQYHFAG